LVYGLALLSAPAQSLPARKAPLNRSGKPAPGEKTLPWLAFDLATDRAKKENKHIIVDVYTQWCGWCKVMDRQTYGNSEVADYLAQNFVLAKLNGESTSQVHWKGRTMTEREFARAIGVTGFPATYFLKPDAEMIGGAPGYIGPGDFMIYAKYISTRWYEKGTPQEYLKSTQQESPQPN